MDRDLENDGVAGRSSSDAAVELSMPSQGHTVGQPCDDSRFAAMRRWPRFHVDMAVQVRVTTQGPTKVATWEGQGTDISAGGLAVVFKGNLPIGSQVGVEFTLPNTDQPTTFRGFVRNRDGNRHGVEFIAENDDDYRKIGELQAILEATNSSAAAPERTAD
jgi:hypothetical protein